MRESFFLFLIFSIFLLKKSTNLFVNFLSINFTNGVKRYAKSNPINIGCKDTNIFTNTPQIILNFKNIKNNKMEAAMTKKNVSPQYT